jgi:hypothetical protein
MAENGNLLNLLMVGDMITTIGICMIVVIVIALMH